MFRQICWTSNLYVLTIFILRMTRQSRCTYKHTYIRRPIRTYIQTYIHMYAAFSCTSITPLIEMCRFILQYHSNRGSNSYRSNPSRSTIHCLFTNLFFFSEIFPVFRNWYSIFINKSLATDNYFIMVSLKYLLFIYLCATIRSTIIGWAQWSYFASSVYLSYIIID